MRRIVTLVLAAMVALAILPTEQAAAGSTTLLIGTSQSPDQLVRDAEASGTEPLWIADVAGSWEARTSSLRAFMAANPRIRYFQLGKLGQLSSNDYQERAWQAANTIKAVNPNAQTFLVDNGVDGIRDWSSCGGNDYGGGSRRCFDGVIVGTNVRGTSLSIVTSSSSCDRDGNGTCKAKNDSKKSKQKKKLKKKKG